MACNSRARTVWICCSRRRNWNQASILVLIQGVCVNGKKTRPLSQSIKKTKNYWEYNTQTVKGKDLTQRGPQGCEEKVHG